MRDRRRLLFLAPLIVLSALLAQSAGAVRAYQASAEFFDKHLK